jgi:predicted SnoaL-like aldol condensation-catalyzing enzyme
MSCNSKDAGGISEKAQKNIDANNAIMKMFETGDWSKVGEYIDSNGVDHAGMNGDIVGLDSIKAEFAKMSKMMSNMKNETVKVLADDDYVMCWAKESGKMNVDGLGMKAGDNFLWNAIEVSKFKDGKSTEHWSFISWGDMMNAMAKMMPPPMTDDKKMDDKKKK